jgi:hypothetical protein
MPFAVNRNGFGPDSPTKRGQKYATTQVAINQRSKYFDKRRLTRFIAALDSLENFAAERPPAASPRGTPTPRKNSTALDVKIEFRLKTNRLSSAAAPLAVEKRR